MTVNQPIPPKRCINRPVFVVDDRSMGEIQTEDERVLLALGLEPDISRPICKGPAFADLSQETFERLYKPRRYARPAARRSAVKTESESALPARALPTPQALGPKGAMPKNVPQEGCAKSRRTSTKRGRKGVKSRGTSSAGSTDSGVADLFG